MPAALATGNDLMRLDSRFRPAGSGSTTLDSALAASARRRADLVRAPAAHGPVPRAWAVLRIDRLGLPAQSDGSNNPPLRAAHDAGKPVADQRRPAAPGGAQEGAPGGEAARRGHLRHGGLHRLHGESGAHGRGGLCVPMPGGHAEPRNAACCALVPARGSLGSGLPVEGGSAA